MNLASERKACKTSIKYDESKSKYYTERERGLHLAMIEINISAENTQSTSDKQLAVLIPVFNWKLF